MSVGFIWEGLSKLVLSLASTACEAARADAERQRADAAESELQRLQQKLREFGVE
jgi:hypothetical protein